LEAGIRDGVNYYYYYYYYMIYIAPINKS